LVSVRLLELWVHLAEVEDLWNEELFRPVRDVGFYVCLTDSTLSFPSFPFLSLCECVCELLEVDLKKGWISRLIIEFERLKFNK
jgi:hypothetical protein